VTVGLAAAGAPGPLHALLLSLTLQNGWRRTLPAAFAPLISDGPIILLVVLVLTQTPAWFLRGLQIIGGLFILYLARGAWQAFRQAPGDLEVPAATRQSGLLKAGLMNLLNPNPYIFWATVNGPILIRAWRVSPWHAAAFLLGFYGTFVTLLVGLVAFFGWAGGLGRGANRLMYWVATIVLAGFGLFLLVSGVRG
jgi:threonine/homoserine/homoserine lactone efflux protein